MEKYSTRLPVTPILPRGGILLAGIALGAIAVYLLEPRTRLRRQALLRDKTWSLAHHSLYVAARLSRHLRNRIGGLIAITTDVLKPEGIDSDTKIAARVRSELGRATRHAHSVTVSVDKGRVSLRGALPPHEAGTVVRAIEVVKGVRGVENLITPPLAEGHSPIQ
jgi:hyperosmotically inducible protein